MSRFCGDRTAHGPHVPPFICRCGHPGLGCDCRNPDPCPGNLPATESGWKAKSERQEADLREACNLLRDFAKYVEDSQVIVNGEAVVSAIRLVCDADHRTRCPVDGSSIATEGATADV